MVQAEATSIKHRCDAPFNGKPSIYFFTPTLQLMVTTPFNCAAVKKTGKGKNNSNGCCVETPSTAVEKQGYTRITNNGYY